VGGFPVLVRDSIEQAGLDSAGGAGFGPVRHPRTVVGMAAGGRRLFLVTIDGRQPGYSVGMTLREAARLALDLGATEALNLDGGGSTTMAVRRDSSGRERYEVVNRPSDPQGERPVGNALALVCLGAR
jgi:exopolysaccharide biosynthesis protein